MLPRSSALGGACRELIKGEEVIRTLQKDGAQDSLHGHYLSTSHDSDPWAFSWTRLMGLASIYRLLQIDFGLLYITL